MAKIIRTTIFMLVFSAFAVHAATYNGPIPQGPKYQQLRNYLAGRTPSPGAIPQGSKWAGLRSYIEELEAEKQRAEERRRRQQQTATYNGPIPQGQKYQQLRNYLAGRTPSPGAIPQGSKWAGLRSYIDALEAEKAQAKSSRRQRQ